MPAALKSRTHEAIKQRTSESRAVISTLKSVFPSAKVDAYRYSVGSIRVRVIDGRFHRMRASQRYDLVSTAIETLPEPIQADIIFLVLLTPEEHRAKISAQDYEFDHPIPTER